MSNVTVIGVIIIVIEENNDFKGCQISLIINLMLSSIWSVINALSYIAGVDVHTNKINLDWWVFNSSVHKRYRSGQMSSRSCGHERVLIDTSCVPINNREIWRFLIGTKQV